MFNAARDALVRGESALGLRMSEWRKACLDGGAVRTGEVGPHLDDPPT